MSDLYTRTELDALAALKLPDDLNQQNTAQAVKEVLAALVSSQVNILDDGASTGTPAPPASNPVPFVPIAANQYGQHPAFATQQELDAWLLPRVSAAALTIYTGTYQTSANDYQKKCSGSAPGSYSYPLATAYSIVSQQAADALAKATGLSVLACALPPLTASQILPFLKAGTGIAIDLDTDGKILISSTVQVGPGTPQQPSAPTNGQVDDTSDTFSFLANPAYPAFSQYKVAGLPGVSGAVYLDGVNAYVANGRIYIKVVGAVPTGGLAVYVAGSGAIPDGKPLLSNAPFTGTATPGGTITPDPTLGTPSILVYPTTAY